MKQKLLIIIEGGMIQSIASNSPIDIVINDYDNDEDDQVYGYTLDAVFKDGEAFRLLDREKVLAGPLSPSEVLLREHLRDIKF